MTDNNMEAKTSFIGGIAIAMTLLGFGFKLLWIAFIVALKMAFGVEEEVA